MPDWKDFVKRKYHEMKKTNPAVKLGAAMKEAAKEWKVMKGTMGAPASKSRKSMRKSKKSRKSRKSRR